MEKKKITEGDLFIDIFKRKITEALGVEIPEFYLAEDLKEIQVVLENFFGGAEAVLKAFFQKKCSLGSLSLEAKKEALEVDAKTKLKSCENSIDLAFEIVQDIISNKPKKLLLTLKDLKEDLRKILEG